MLHLDPSSPEELALALSKAVTQSGLTLAEICQRPHSMLGYKTPAEMAEELLNPCDLLQQSGTK